MKSPRPKRLRKERVPWEAAVAHTLGAAKKTERKTPILSLITSFLTVPVAQALLFLGILCTGTTRKNAMGVPEELIKLKKKNQALIWNSTFSEIVDGVNCFLWQDNNAVLGITTAYSLHQVVQR